MCTGLRGCCRLVGLACFLLVLGLSPAAAGAATPAVTAAGGGYHTCLLDSTGSVWCWGWNIYGQVGNGTTASPQPVPVRVAQGAVPAGTRMTAITAGRVHSCALDESGQVWCWGDNTSGQTGDGTTTTPRSVPVKVAQGATAAGTRMTAISAGVSHTCALDSTGWVWCWGDNTFGQLGDGTTTRATSPVKVAQGAVPAGTRMVAVAAGGDHTCALDSTGQVWCWGDNTYGQAGNGTTTTPVTAPVKVLQGAMPAGTTVTAITLGQWHSCALDSTGKLWCWGDNAFAQLGIGSATFAPVTSPVAVAQGGVPAGTTMVALGGGQVHSCALDSTGKVWCWGDNTYGQIGNGTSGGNAPSPVAVAQGAMAAATTIDSISSGELHTCALDAGGRLWCWGRNDFGELGDGTTTTPRTSPVGVLTPATTTTVSCAPATVPVGGAPRCTVTVADADSAGTTPTGTVSFSSDAAGSFSGSGSCTLAAGSCQLTYTPSAPGSHQITGSYGGDAAHIRSSGQQTITVAALPSVRITTPADGALYAKDHVVDADYSCGADPAAVPVMCSAPVLSGQPIHTSTRGPHSFTVTAKDKLGSQTTKTVSYTVIGPPAARITTPAGGATYRYRQLVTARYSCSDDPYGPGIKSCAGTVPNGAPINTSKPGKHTFTVTAISKAGRRKTVTSQYTVLPNNHFAVKHVQVHRDGSVEFDVTVPGPGQLDVLETAWNPSTQASSAQLKPGPYRFAFARRHLTIARAGTLHVKALPGEQGRQVVRHHQRPLHLNLWITYQPNGGNAKHALFWNLFVSN